MSVCWLDHRTVDRSVIISLKGKEVTLPCSYMSKYYEHLNILLPFLLLPLLVRREAEAEEDEAEEPGHLFSESTPLADNYFRCVAYLLDTNSLSH